MNLNSKQLKSFFIGTLLGDSYIHNGAFYCKQISEDLVNFKAEIIRKSLPNSKVSVVKHTAYTDKNGAHHQEYWQLSVRSNKYIRKLEKIFYSNGSKIYPKHIISKLDSLGFAMWYADDGTSILVQHNDSTGGSKNRRVQICTDSFTDKEHLEIKKDLEKLGYDIKIINRCRRGQKRIQINKNKQSFICLLEKWFYKFPSLLYKLDLGYRGSSLLKDTYISEEYKACYTRISAHHLFFDRMRNK